MAIQTSLKSQDFRQSIQDSRQKFLDKLCENFTETEETKPKKNEAIRRRSVSRKISTKVRKTSSTYRKSRITNIQKTTINVNSVAELACKFNEIIEKQNVPKAEVKLQKLARRLSSFNNNSFKEMPQTNPCGTNENKRKELRKPSIKKKPNFDEKYSKVQSAKKISNSSMIIPENNKELKPTKQRNENKNEELPECVPEDFEQNKSPSIGFVKAAIQNFEKKTFKPIISKRSLSEVHRVDSTNILESESSRRRSCKPDLQIPKKTETTKNAQKLNDDGVELRDVKVGSVSEPNLILTKDLKTPQQETALFNSTISHLSSSTSKIYDIPALFSKKIAENRESLSKSEDLKFRILEKEKLENSEDASEDNEGVGSCKIVEAFNLHVGESYYSVTDIVKSTSSEIEGNENDYLKKNSGSSQKNIKPNTSFLWNKSSYNLHQFNTVGLPYVSTIIRPTNTAKSVDRTAFSKTLPKDFKDGIVEESEKIYEELDTGDDYELFDLNDDYEEVKVVKDEKERDYEYVHNTEENIYETLPLKKQDVPLPRRPSSKNSDSVSNGYESIYNSDPAKEQSDSNYESIYFQELSDKKDNLEKDATESVISSDQKTNSLYGTASLISWNEGTIYNGSTNSDISFSDKSEWIDVSDDDEDGKSKIVIVRDTAKNKKTGSWSQQCRQQWSKASKCPPNEGGENDSDHLYETLHTKDNEDQNGCYDSFSSDTESENSFQNLEDRENNGDLPLPAAPNNDVLTRLAATASKHMRKFTKNLSMTRSDISRSLTRITTARRKSRNDLSEVAAAENNSCDNSNNETPATTPNTESNPITKIDIEDNNEKNKSMSRKGFLSKIRRSIIISPEQANELTSTINNKGRSTFYLTPTINVDDYEDSGEKKTEDDSGISLSPIDRERNARIKPIRPQNPPPPIPVVTLNEGDEERSSQENSRTPKSPIYSNRVTRVRGVRPNIPPPPVPIVSEIKDDGVGKTEDKGGIASSSRIYKNIKMKVVRPATPPPPVPILAANKVQHSTIYEDEDEDSGKMKTGGNTGIYLRRVYSPKNARNNPVRPKIPPPPVPKVAPPADLKKRLKEKRSTSWYAEVNLCKGSENKNDTKVKQSNTCWYGEIGLYQNSTSTPSTSSAENSGTNTNVTIRRPTSTTPSVHSNQDKDNTEKYNIRDDNSYYNSSLNSNSSKTEWPITNLPGEDIQMRLQNEPLYQFYDAAVTNSVYRDGMSDIDSENYEDIERRLNSEAMPPSRPSAMELIVPKRNSLAFSKTLWCEIPEVLQSSVLSTLSLHQKKLQEAKFEMVTSEASYLNSLNVLNDHFMKNLRATLTEDEYESLFGKIEAVRQSSDRLLLDLEKCWQDNILLHGVCDIIKKHAEEDFNVYIPFCENHVLLEHTMKKIRERSSFADTVKQLETSPVCQCLSLYSFLMLPMQRITRWPLLLDAVLKRVEETDPEYITCQYVLATINKIVGQCNEAARRKEREIEMLNIESKMEFAKGVPAFELAIPNRWLIRSGSIVHMLPRSEEIKLTFGKKISKATLHLFLFNDLFIVAKPKSDNTFSVMHYCSRNFTELGTSEHLLTLPGKEMTGKHLFFLTILENQNKKTVEFLFSCSSESDKQRWIEALSPPKSEDPDEVLYECWDCPQVTVIHNYTAVQPDELNLSKGDVINVSRKMADGWFQGERIRDGQTGWFPANYVVEIANPHVRARNLKQRYRLLTFSENYLKNN